MKTEIIEFHNTDIYCPVENDQIYVAVKPICQAIGVDHSSQIRNLKNDPILGSVVVNMTTTGRDSKAYHMACLPYRYIFGWLFRIDVNKVKDESKEHIITYQKKCYDVLFDYFFKKTDRYKKRDEVILSTQDEIDKLTENRKQMNREIKAKKAYIKDLLSKSLDQLDLFDES